ncbi:MAG TPA: NRDE family protein [Puia sp.]|jgi:hypothetical protein
MCTVTFIPGRDDIYLTSNRDEHTSRRQALHPRSYRELIYPKDATAGGSWIALKNSGDAAVLLNGAFVRHRRLNGYRKSRGLVFLDIVESDQPLTFFGDLELSDIEPFTLVLFVSQRLFECRWDGIKKHMVQLNAADPHIWSSVTLYDETVRDQRRAWLNKWYQEGNVSEDRVLDFHRSTRAKQGEIATVSITSIRIKAGNGKLTYYDLKETGGISAHKVAEASRTHRPLSRLFIRMRRLFIRLRSWEYWPFPIVYAPIFLYWVWLSGKARSFFFFSTANPSILNAGFLLESKKDIYGLLPAGSFPKTLFCPLGTTPADIEKQQVRMGLSFPLMAKPDVGQRGLQVKLLQTGMELSAYATNSKVDFLLQEYIDYPHEIGVFYYRIPGEPKGHISGIVGKELLAVTGDGRSTVEELLVKQNRALLQLPVLRKGYGEFLRQTLKAGEQLTLVPYGNHSRGAKFIDWSDRIEPRLIKVIDDYCCQIPGFYFGRLDIKFSSWEELSAGKAFSVIELNGAGSEPTHVYDPAHSIFFAWKEIIRHLRLLYQVSRANAQQQGLRSMSFSAGWKMLRDYARHEKLIS